jgi:hypothetical protein
MATALLWSGGGWWQKVESSPSSFSKHHAQALNPNLKTPPPHPPPPQVLGTAAKLVIGKEFCTIVGDGSTQADVTARVKQIRNLAENTEQDYEREKLNERIARLSGGVAIIQVGGLAGLLDVAVGCVWTRLLGM